jgi:hypothetical protein
LRKLKNDEGGPKKGHRTYAAQEKSMGVEKTTVDSVDVDQKQWYRVGGIAALVLGVAYVIIVFLYARVGAPPTGVEAWFKYLPGKTTVWWVILGLSVFTDFLYVPLAFALYMALKAINRNAMLLATAFQRLTLLVCPTVSICRSRLAG